MNLVVEGGVNVVEGEINVVVVVQGKEIYVVEGGVNVVEGEKLRMMM